MFALIPLLALVLLAVFVNSYLRSLQAAVISAAVLWGVFLTAITEGLSLCGQMTRTGLLVAWTILIAMMFGLTIWSRRGKHKLDARITPRPGLDEGRAIRNVVYLLAITLAAVAMVAPPNTGDSITYHMSRVMHWIQNRSVAHYPTNMTRQLELSPGAEYVILHLQLLTGDDRIANLPQWFAMIGSLLATSLIAARLGAGPLGRLLAAVFCFSIPMGILQSTSTQNDYVLTFWLACSTWLVLELSHGDSCFSAVTGSALFGAAFGLALLTKSIAFLYGPPLLVWFIIVLHKRAGPRLWRPALLAVTTTLCINACFLYRNYHVFGRPLGEQSLTRVVSNASHGPKTLASNLIRNLAVHANLPIPGAIEAATHLVRALHGAVGANPDDPETTYQGLEPALGQTRRVSDVGTFRIYGPFHHEDEAGCGVHLILIIACIALCLVVPRLRRQHLVGYASVWAIAFVIFCFYLRWQPWHSRLHLPLFVLFSPFVGVTLSTYLSRRTFRRVAWALLLTALPYVFANQSRPIIGIKQSNRNLLTLTRRELVFYNRPELQDSYEQIARAIAASGCDRIGLVMGDNECEYPFWLVLHDMAPQRFVIRHLDVKNASSMLECRPPFDPFHPCVIAVWDENGRPELFDADGYFARHPPMPPCVTPDSVQSQ